MTDRPPVLTVVAAASVGLFSWLGVSAEAPEVWSPLPAVTILPQMLLSMLLSEAGVLHGRTALWLVRHLIPFVLGPALFVLWNLQLLKGVGEVPRRSRIGLVALSVLTAFALISGWRDGLINQGRVYTASMAALNACSLVTSWTLYRFALKQPTFLRSLAFHWSTTVWLVWLAFPWFGQIV